MTANQIAYWNLVESMRSNRAKEQETGRHNLASESLGYQTLSETGRSNRAKENISLLDLAERSRHNVATETVESGKLAETKSYNAAQQRMHAAGLENAKTVALIREGYGPLLLGKQWLQKTERVKGPLVTTPQQRGNTQKEKLGILESIGIMLTGRKRKEKNNE